MARIDEYLRKILSARYGKDVRGAIHDSIEEINNVNEANIGTVQAIADTAQGYANNASDSADTAEQAVTDAQAQVTLAQQQVTLATTQAENASDSAEDSEAWAVGKRGGVDVPSTDDTYQNNAKYWQERANYWYQQAQAIAESFSGALRPIGTVAFADLPSIAEAEAGDMYNVSDEFTTTSDYKEGAGHRIPLGSNVYKTIDGKWDVLAGSPVTGIKGDSESAYRKGNVNITKANIGLGNVDNESLGSADISSIGDGSVKGAISRLNSDLANQHVMYEQKRHSFGFTNPTDLADALDQTAKHILSYLQGLPNGVSAEILNMKFIGAGSFSFASDTDTIYDNTATDFSIHCFTNSTSGTTMYLYDMICWAGTPSANRISRAAITNGANPTFSNLSLSDLSTLTGFNFDIRTWKKL